MEKELRKFSIKKSDAKKFKIEMKYEKQRQLTSIVSINNHITFAEFSKEWFKSEVKGRKALQTQRTYSNDLRRFILPVIAEVKRREINIRHALLIVLKTILNDAVKSDHLIKNPIHGYSGLREPPKTIKFWPKEEINTFLEYTKDHAFFDFYVTTLNTGMRLGEILGFQWVKLIFSIIKLLLVVA